MDGDIAAHVVARVDIDAQTETILTTERNTLRITAEGELPAELGIGIFTNRTVAALTLAAVIAAASGAFEGSAIGTMDADVAAHVVVRVDVDP